MLNLFQMKNKNFKIFFWTFLLWAINLKIFVFLANYKEIKQIWQYSDSLFGFYVSVWTFYLQFITTIPWFTALLTFSFMVMLFVFWLYYFLIYFNKFPGKSMPKTGGWGILATIITYLGFGCVACGQTLITSVLFLFASNSSMFFAETMGNLSMLFGLVILYFGIKKNYKIYHNKNICRI